jgi:transcription termination/antitermination protein NusA
MIPNALQPAQIEEVFLYPRLGRAIVLVKEDQLSLGIGRRGQNVRLASKLVGWDIEIMTLDELNEGIEKAENWFKQIPETTDAMVEMFIEEGFLSYDDLTFMEPAQLGELAGVTEEVAESFIAYAEEAAKRVEEETRATRAAEAEAGVTERPAVSSRPPSPASAAANLFPPDEDGAKVQEVKPTVESLFGPDTSQPKEDHVPSAAEVFGDMEKKAQSGDTPETEAEKSP